MRNILLNTFSLVAIGATSVAAQGGTVRVSPPTGAMVGGRTATADSAIVRSGRIMMFDSAGVVSSYSASRPRIGVTVSLASGSNDAVGALIETVIPKGPADKAGVKVGDIIMKVNDVTIANPTTVGTAGGQSIVGTKLIETLAGLKPGVPAMLQLKRGKETLSVKVTPELDDTQVTTTFFSPRFSNGAIAESSMVFMKVLPELMARRDQMADREVTIAREMRTLNEELVRGLPSTSIGTMMRSSDSGRRALELALPAGASGTMSYRVSFDALSRLELAPINADLGSYFGATEGVLVISIAPAVTVRTIRAGAAYSGTVTTPPPTATATVKDAPTPGSAEVLNLKPGDVITAVDGRKVATPSDLMRILRSYQRNEDVKLTVLRQKRSTTINTKMPSE